MRSVFDDRPGNVLARAAAAIAFGVCWTPVVHSGEDADHRWRASAAAQDVLAADAPVRDPSGTQLAPGHPHPPNQTEAPRETEGIRKPERRDRVRDGGAEDELRERGRLMLAARDPGFSAQA